MTEKFMNSGLIQPSELHQLMHAVAPVRLVDASYVLGGPVPIEPFNHKRIGDAVFFDIDGISDKSSPLPHMLPSPADFEKAVGPLGISNDDFIVIYGQTQKHFGPARAWWTFRVFGHDNVCVLDGGLPAWECEVYAVNTDAPVKLPPATFKAKYRPELVADLKQMQAGGAQIFDARPPDRFDGRTPEPRPNLHSGHIPGSVNTPGSVFTDPSTNKLKSKTELEQILAGYQPGKPAYATCGSGVTACVIALALHTLGHKDIAVYDGSWAEWGAIGAKRPVGTKNGGGGSA